MSFDLDQRALDIIDAWEAGEYLHPAQKKAALQVAIRDALATPLAAPATTDEEVARMVQQLEDAYQWIRRPDWADEFSLSDTVAWINARPVGAIRLAADLLARVARERDEARLVARYETDVAAAEIEGRKAAEARLAEVEKERDELAHDVERHIAIASEAEQRAEAAEKALREAVGIVDMWVSWCDGPAVPHPYDQLEYARAFLTRHGGGHE